MLTEITLENFRCFHEQQTARLAPLTLLVGENSTGKTSFLALLRALAEFANTGETPRFTEPPYELGSFADIVHHTEGNFRLQSFDAGFKAIYPHQETEKPNAPISFSVTFEEHAAAPVPVRRRISHNDAWIEDRLDEKNRYSIVCHTCRGDWSVSLRRPFGVGHDELGDYSHTLSIALRPLRRASIQRIDIDTSQFHPIATSPEIAKIDMIDLQNIVERYFFSYRGNISDHTYAGAPIRSQPQRTYRPSRPTPDPEGNYIPSYFADLSVRNPREWRILKNRLEEFGREAGLFDSIDIMQYGEAGSGPFEIQIHQSSDKLQRTRNLIDMGYGVSQVLPIITELQRPIPRRSTSIQYLLQQPEVHLHPSAQAALGSLLCNLASEQRQLFVETHSDYIVDRIRMDVRDGRTDLQEQDVSILYFERRGTDVVIHSLQLDEGGQINGQPESYRNFFTAEVRRQLEL